MAAPVELIKLVEQFREHPEMYMSDSFSETSLRIQFVDPMFELLGWDVYNRQSYAEAYKDVVHEDSLKIGGSTKAPDYSFRIGGVRKFFVEAKKPFVKIKQDIAPAFQLRRYAWSAKLPLSILTDFEEFAVYDCRVRPEKTDSPSTARTLYITFDQLEDRWDDIAAIFSREAVLKGSFDKYADSTKKKRGTAEVDAAFLDEIEQWRALLARNLALRNPQLSQRDLNFAVQKTIDRIIFLRICEDRGMETYGRLQVLPNGPDIYPRLCELFHEADHRYNSGLFHFVKEKERHETPDEWTLSLAIDDAVLKEIIRKLYYPESPYEFSVFGADILGQVYEQFLGKVIRLTTGHQAKVEEKPEVRKAGGVYYTPTYIVDYIVRNTVGKLLEGKTPYDVAARTPTWKPTKGGRPLSVLDPACGSGSFLIGAYQYLLDWYRDWFVADDPVRHKDRVYQPQKGPWRLTTAERKRILLDHIYGVDIDSQAVEVTKLSLLLKVLEGETKETLQRQLFAKQRALPDLADNIKCGNSLIGPDFYHGKQLDLFDADERMRINVFDWQAEFREIMQSGGFDAVVGNPPYGATVDELLMEYVRSHFSTLTNSLDTYIMFMERSLHVLRGNGRFGMIVPSGWVSVSSAAVLRKLFAKSFQPETFVSLPYDVFKGAYVDTVVTTARRLNATESWASISDGRTELTVCPLRFRITTVDDLAPFRKVGGFTDWAAESGFLILSSSAELDLIRRLKSTDAVMSDFVDVMRGVEAFHPSSRTGMVNPTPAHTGSLLRYQLTNGEELFFDYSPSIESAKPRHFFFNPRILLRQLVSRKFRLQATYTERVLITNQSIQSLVPRPDGVPLPIVLAILNSRLLSWYFCQVNTVARRDDFPKTIIKTTRSLPMPRDLKNAAESQVGRDMMACVTSIMSLFEDMALTKGPHEHTTIQRQIEATDREIDKLVYTLFGLNDGDIRLIEEATPAVAK